LDNGLSSLNHWNVSGDLDEDKPLSNKGKYD
jgi:hypothetical protein